jgi:DNA-binding MarR family transcriptional regulator
VRFDNPIESLAYETAALFHRLKVVVEQLHGRDMTAHHRGILKGIELRGPQTVPQMARARPVSRQHIRAAIAPLLAQGLVEFVDNPDHKRSKILRLTAAGLARLEEINRREREVFGKLAAAFDPAELERAAGVLRALRELLAAGTWEEPPQRPPHRKRKRP